MRGILIFLSAIAMVLPATADPQVPRVEITPILHQGDPAENGWIAFVVSLAGPGIIPDFNNMANFAGPTDDIRKWS